jgi:uncharacterized protein YdeI (YjbR/CyaY-like superfamily)
METNKGIETFHAPTRRQWREWLEKHGQSKKEVCLIIYGNQSKTESVSYHEAIEEALCFGWIDSLTNKRGAGSVYQRFTPRKPNSNWSASNRERVERLAKAGLMMEHGQRLIDMAIQKGKWESAGTQSKTDRSSAPTCSGPPGT